MPLFVCASDEQYFDELNCVPRSTFDLNCRVQFEIEPGMILALEKLADFFEKEFQGAE